MRRSTILLIAVVLMATWYVTGHTTVGSMKRLVSGSLPLGTRADSVLAFLNARHFQYSELAPSIGDTYCPRIKGLQVISAAKRGLRARHPWSDGIFLVFCFGPDSLLVKVDVHESFTSL